MDFLQGQSIVHRTNETVLADVAFKKKSLILYYFTGLDCDACRAFDPKLFEVYNEALFRRIELAVVIISNDENKEDFLTNLRTNYNDWYAIKFGDELNQ